jgi:RsiW-degrading membrane proteinase PrsW (M82 family)
MPIRINCTGCEKGLVVAERHAGKRIRCPACQSTLQVPKANESLDLDDDSIEPAPGKPATGRIDAPSEDEAEEGDVYRLSSGFEHPMEAESAISPVAARTFGKKKRPPVESARFELEDLQENSWRDHFVWVLVLALIPLAVSINSLGPTVVEQITETLEKHPELIERMQNAESKYAFLEELPDKRLIGAHLPVDTNLHWGYAFLSAGLFLTVLCIMSPPGCEAGPMRLIWTGVVTGTVGIFLLLAVQFLAGATAGINLHGRGILIILFWLVKLIGFSYRAALDPENGFFLSFFGFTLGVGFCEELCKAIPVMLFLRKNGDVGWRTACLVGMASGIGFGISEGISYSSEYYNGVSPLVMYLVRFLSCVALHAFWAAAVAILMRENQDYLFHDGFEWEDAGNFVLHYLLIAMVLHGLYDTLIKRDYLVWALLLAMGSFGWLAWLVSNRRRVEAA